MKVIRIVGAALVAGSVMVVGCSRSAETGAEPSIGERSGAAVETAADKTAEGAKKAATATKEAAIAVGEKTKEVTGKVLEKSGEVMGSAGESMEATGEKMQEK